MASVRYLTRVVSRLILLCMVLAWAAIDYGWSVWRKGKSSLVSARAEWMQRQSRRILRVLAVSANYQGSAPSRGVLVSNHLSYLDILVLSAHSPLIFVSKEEVAHWPVFGFLSRLGGTLFIRRERRSDLLRIAKVMPRMLESGVVIGFFPEGTSSAGTEVLPFHAGLLAPAVEHDWPVTPACIQYRVPQGEGSVERDVAYWGEMVFGPHLLRLLGISRIEATVHYGAPEHPAGTRQQLALKLYESVKALRLQIR